VNVLGARASRPPSALHSLELKLYEVSDNLEVLSVEGNQRSTEAVTGQGNKDIVDEYDFLALEVGAAQNNFDSGETSFLPVLIGRIDNPSDTFKGPKEVLHATDCKVVCTTAKQFLGDHAGEEG